MQPTELYQFRQGAKAWYYTNGIDDVAHESKTYKASPLKRDSINQSTDAFKNNLKLEFPRTDEFARDFLGVTPEFVTTVAVLRDEDDGYSVAWKGRVLTGKANDNVITLECESVFTSLKRIGLRARYEKGCRHALYSRNCGVLQDSYRDEANVIGVDGGVTIRYTGAVQDDGYFTAGIAKVDDAIRFIRKHTQGEIIITRPFNDDVTNKTIYLYPGCDHLKATCKDKFNNLDNFGGFPFIPDDNPFTDGSIA